jgi:hypothetical protein
MKKPMATVLRVIVKTVSRTRTPYSWVIVDDSDGREVQQSPGRFRTSSLAWDAGVAALILRRELIR